MSCPKWVLGFVTAIFSISSWALPGYTTMPTCGSARVVSGSACENIVVEINFSGCALKSNPLPAQKTVCEDSKLKARFLEGNYRYEAQFTPSKDVGWGTGTWKSLGANKQWKKNQAVEATAPAKPQVVEPPPALNAVAKTASEPAPVVAAPVAVVSPFKFSGYADLRYTSFTSKDNLSVANAHAESGFGIEDGAVYLNFEKNKLAVVVDVAFRRSKDSDTNPSTIPNQSSNANFAIGVDKSQLYLRYSLHENLYFDFGQFDTIYGVELNDSKDRIFGKTGLVYDSTLPVTHTGAALGYAAAGFAYKIFAANPNNKGTNGTSTAGDENSEYGGAIGFSNSTFRTQLGYMTRPIFKASGGALAGRNLIDITAGISVNKFSLDVEYAIVDDPNKNTLTTSDNTDREKPGTGFLVLAAYEISDNLLLGGRYEHLQDDPAAANLKTVDSYGLSGHYKLSPELELRSEYIGYSFKNLSDVSWDDSRINFAFLIKF